MYRLQMIESDKPTYENATKAQVRIEHGGGWRLFMKAPTSHRSGMYAVTTSQMREYPRTILAEAFLLAKIGNPKGARNQLQALQSIVCESDDALLGADIELVDAHIRVYEDRALSDADSKRLTQLLLALSADDLI